MAQDASKAKSQPQAEPKKAKGGEPPKVHVLNTAEVTRRSHSAQRMRRRLTLLSFVLFVILPVAAVTYYYSALATDRYAVESKFAIRSPSSTGATDLLGLVSGVSSSGSTTTDSYMVLDFIHSRDLIDRLEQRLDLTSIYSRPDADFLNRLDPDATKEDLVSYLNRMVSVHYDTSSQIITLEVQAFTPEHAQAVSADILDISGELINEISERARQDTMRSAEREVARVQDQLEAHRERVAAFRQSRQEIDPSASAAQQIGLVSELERELASARTRMSSLTEFLDAEAPSVRILQSQIAAMELELQEQRARLGSGTEGGDPIDPDTLATGQTGATLTSRIGEYEDLAIDLEFLQRAYLSALASREGARLEADRAQRYLAAFVQPTVPEKSIYPKRTQNILIFAAFAIMVWGIGVMIVYIVREHSS